MQKTIKALVVAVFTLFTLLNLSCYRATIDKGLNAVSSEIGAIVCPQSYDVVLDFFSQVVVVEQKQMSQMNESEFAQAMDTDTVFNGVANSYLKEELFKLFQEFYQDVKYLSSYETNNDLPQLVSYLKVEDADNKLRKELIEKYKSKISDISKNMQSMGYSCPSDNDMNGRNPDSEEPIASPPISSPPAMTEREKVTSQLTYAMKKVLSVTYQSCLVIDRKPLDKTDKDVKGIKEECCYENTRGLVRHIENLSLVQSTHPYLQPSYGSKCINIRNNPLIYDFGGRPAYTRGSSGKLNFFQNGGGSEVLGYDCSAMVYTVVMGGGFRLKENKLLIASDVEAAQSRQFLDPESKGWSCLNSVVFADQTSDALLPGDVASMDGHTFMIYRTGKDPYGIENIADCKKVDAQKFDFDIMQSSPSKDGVGVNVYVAKDYLATNETMLKGFVEYAKNYCERVKNKSTKKIKLDYFSLVRVSDKAECKMPAVRFENESCVSACL